MAAKTKTWLISAPISGAKDWLGHFQRLRGQAARIAASCLCIGADDAQDEDGIYNGHNGTAISVHDAMHCEGVIMGSGWTRAKGCEYEFYIALENGVQTLFFELGDGTLVRYERVSDGG